MSRDGAGCPFFDANKHLETFILFRLSRNNTVQIMAPPIQSTQNFVQNPAENAVLSESESIDIPCLSLCRLMDYMSLCCSHRHEPGEDDLAGTCCSITTGAVLCGSIAAGCAAAAHCWTAHKTLATIITVLTSYAGAQAGAGLQFLHREYERDTRELANTISTTSPDNSGRIVSGRILRSNQGQ